MLQHGQTGNKIFALNAMPLPVQPRAVQKRVSGSEGASQKKIENI